MLTENCLTFFLLKTVYYFTENVLLEVLFLTANKLPCYQKRDFNSFLYKTLCCADLIIFLTKKSSTIIVLAFNFSSLLNLTAVD